MNQTERRKAEIRRRNRRRAARRRALIKLGALVIAFVVLVVSLALCIRAMFRDRENKSKVTEQGVNSVTEQMNHSVTEQNEAVITEEQGENPPSSHNREQGTTEASDGPSTESEEGTERVGDTEAGRETAGESPLPACRSFVYGTSELGRSLTCYEICGERVERTVLLNFAIHGFEDEYDGDGQVLVDLARELVEHYSASEELYGCRLLIVPCANPDGLYEGHTNNGFGRCNANGVDLNRDFDANYRSYTSERYYTPYAFSAAESRALRDLCLEYKPEVVIDFHGWLNETIGDKALAELFRQEMGLPYLVGYTDSNCAGYFANWAHQNGALSLLVEFTASNKIDRQALITAVNRLLSEEY